MKIGPSGGGGGMAQSMQGGRELGMARRQGKQAARMGNWQLGTSIGRGVTELANSIAQILQRAQQIALMEKELGEKKREQDLLEETSFMPEVWPEGDGAQGPPLPREPIAVHRAESDRIRALAEKDKPDRFQRALEDWQLADLMAKGGSVPPNKRGAYLGEGMTGTPGPVTKEVEGLGRVMTTLRGEQEPVGETGILPPKYFTRPETERPAEVGRMVQKILGLGLPKEDIESGLGNVRANMGVDVGPYLGELYKKIGAGKAYQTPPTLPASPLPKQLQTEFPHVPEIPWSGGKAPYQMPTQEEIAYAKALEQAWFPPGPPPPAQPIPQQGNPLTYPFRSFLDSFKSNPR
jgi:hypothetical protein